MLRPSLICVQMRSYDDPRCIYEDFFPADVLFINVRALALSQAGYSGLCTRIARLRGRADVRPVRGLRSDESAAGCVSVGACC